MSLTDLYGDDAKPVGNWRSIWMGTVGDHKGRD